MEIRADLLKGLNDYCNDRGYTEEDTINYALDLWLTITKEADWNAIADVLPTGSFKGSALMQFAYDQAEKNSIIHNSLSFSVQ